MQQRALYEQRSKEWAALYDRAWKAARAIFLRANPLCVCCMQEQKRATPATEVDHIIPHRGDRALFWDRVNWQALCKTCHARKTASERKQSSAEHEQQRIEAQRESEQSDPITQLLEYRA
jgi:5-methylcytosine-specific restriction endonuclease McrA